MSKIHTWACQSEACKIENHSTYRAGPTLTTNIFCNGKATNKAQKPDQENMCQNTRGTCPDTILTN